VVDLVTDVDVASEQEISAALLAAFPTHTILGEEGGTRGGDDARYRWIVDPLDGTTNYAHGFPIFAVSIAVEHAGRLVAGVVIGPALGETYVARAGAGATLNGRPIHVSSTAELKRSLIGSSAMYAERHHPAAARANRLLHATQAVRNLGAAALELCYVADGRIDGFLQPGLQAWDMAAAALIIAQAGGRLSNLRGGPFDIHKHQIVATNGALHDELIALLNPSLGQRLRWLHGGQWPSGD